jgi:hypothetical protein
MNDAPFGELATNPFDRAIMALTGRMPDTWAGLAGDGAAPAGHHADGDGRGA